MIGVDDNLKLKLMKRLSVIFVLTLLLLGCKSERNTRHEVTLVGYIPEVDASMPFMRLPYRVELDDNVMAVMDLVSDSMHYHFLTYPNLSYLYSAGKRGQGPKEIILSTPFHLKNNKAYFLDGARSKLYTYLYSQDKPITYAGEWNLNKTKTTLDFIVVNDSNVVIQDFNGKNRLIRITKQGEEGLFSIPKVKGTVSLNAELAYNWRSFMTYNPELEEVAMATQFGDVIEIYNLNNGDSSCFVGNQGAPKENDGQIEGFCDIKWVGENIYTLFSGRLRADLIRKSEAGKKEPMGGNIIKVFDRGGNVLEEYELDTYINGFTVDELNNRLIGVTANLDTPILFFDMP